MIRRHSPPYQLWLVAALTALSLVFTPLARAAVLAPALDKPAPESLDDLKAIQQQVRVVLDKVIPCTVNIRDGGGQGSGVIVSADGYVLTAGHVSRDAGFEGKGRDITVTLQDGRRLKAKTRGANHKIDSGLVKITDSPPPGGWPHVDMGISADLKKGQWVITTGHPGGFQPDRTPVVRLGRVLQASDQLIRTDCTIVGGDSGGPLFDMTGKVVGIHSRIAIPLTANIHVPVDTYRATWDRLTGGEVWGNGYVGFTADPDAKVCKVKLVTKDTPAAKAGLQPDDVIISFNGKKVATFEDFGEQIRDVSVGTEVPLEVERGDEIVDLKLKIGSRTPRDISLPAMQMEATRDPVTKNNAKVLAAFHDVAQKARKSTVKVLCGKDGVLGTVVGADGWVLTKYSEIKEKKPICKLADGREFDATVAGVQEQYDLALLKLDVSGLTPVEWAPSKEAPVGSWLASVGTGQNPLAIGVVSVASRKGNLNDPRLRIAAGKGGYLGVGLAETDSGGGVKISEVLPGTAAAKAKLQADDVVLSVDGKSVKDVPEFQGLIGAKSPDDKITLKIKREGTEKEITATLGKRPPDRGDIQNSMGGTLSTRRLGFPSFLQHDSVLTPAECGGPVVDLDGKVVGINIARAGRVESYAVPSEAVQPLLFDLSSGNLAPKKEVVTAKAPTAAEKVAELRAALERAKKEKAAVDKKVEDASAALERAEAELKKEKESKTSK
jgi:serine protease Do